MERFFQALGDKTRLRLLNLMGDQEICVCYFVEILGGPQPKISRHLAYLRNAGIVAARREGSGCTIGSSATPYGAAQVLRQTLAWLRRKDNAGGPGAADEGLLRPGEVRPARRRSIAYEPSKRSCEACNVHRSANSRPRLCSLPLERSSRFSTDF